MPSDSSRSRPPAPAAFVAGTRATAPMPLEETSESAWQLFQELQRIHGSPAAPPGAGGPAVARGFEPTQPLHVNVPVQQAQARPRPPAVDLEGVMQLARRNNRACPLPQPWAALHALLPPRGAGGQGVPAPAPVDGPAWVATSAMQKRLRLRDQIEWAGRVGTLPAVFEFLSGLPEEEWHHFG